MLGYFSGRNRQHGIKIFSHNLCTNKLRGKKFFIRFCTRISYVALAQYASAECSFLEFYDYRYKNFQIIHFNFLRYFSKNQYPRNQKDVYLSYQEHRMHAMCLAACLDEILFIKNSMVASMETLLEFLR